MPWVGKFITAIVAGALPMQVAAQTDAIITGSDACSDTAPPVTYGPVQRLDGVMFSFIDGVTFTPCRARVRCDAGTDGESLDLQWDAGQPMLERVWNGWGHYRLAFEGRRGRRAMTGSCHLGPGDFYEIGRVISIRKLSDR